MASAFVQKGAGAFSETITWTGATGAGNCLAVVVVKASNTGEWVASLAGNVNTSQPGWVSGVGTINTIGSKIATGSSYSDFASATILLLPGSANAGGDATTVVTIHGDVGGNIWCGGMEFSGLSNTPFSNYLLNAQTAPGTGTDAVTSGAVTIGTAPSQLVGFAYFNSQSGFTPSTGTGFTGQGLDASINAYMWGENLRFTSTGSQAATFTDHSGGGDATLAIGMVLVEPGSSSNTATIAWVT